MSLFKAPDIKPTDSPIPIAPIDLSKRYDIYIGFGVEDRLYEDVKITGIRTFERITEFSGVGGGYLEIEARNGARIMIPHLHIQVLCEHGVQPAYRLLRRWQPPETGKTGEDKTENAKEPKG